MIISTHENKNYRTISCLPFISSCAPNFFKVGGGASPNCSLRPSPLAVSDQLIIFPKEECTQLKGEQTKEAFKIGFYGEKRGRRRGGEEHIKNIIKCLPTPPPFVPINCLHAGELLEESSLQFINLHFQPKQDIQ